MCFINCIKVWIMVRHNENKKPAISPNRKHLRNILPRNNSLKKPCCGNKRASPSNTNLRREPAVAPIILQQDLELDKLPPVGPPEEGTFTCVEDGTMVFVPTPFMRLASLPPAAAKRRERLLRGIGSPWACYVLKMY